MTPGGSGKGRVWVAVAASAAVLGAVPRAQDRAAIHSAERAAPEVDHGPHKTLVLEGFVLGPDGNPAEGAVVVSRADGRAVTDAAGNYRFEVAAPSEATSVQVTAVSSAGGSLVSSACVAVGGSSGATRVGPLQLTRSDSCSPAWLPTFGGEPGTNGSIYELSSIYALAVYDDGSGPAL